MPVCLAFELFFSYCRLGQICHEASKSIQLLVTIRAAFKDSHYVGVNVGHMSKTNHFKTSFAVKFLVLLNELNF